MSLVLVACVLAAAAIESHLRVSGLSIALCALATIAAATLAIASARADGRQSLPFTRSLGFHLRMASRYERAALVARWRLPEADLERLLGEGIADLAPLLSQPESADDVRRLAEHHRAAVVRLRRWNYLLIGGLIYLAGGILVVDAASGPIGVALAVGQMVGAGG